uniref:Uncharacterized protein n=1 Tax=Colobus angolensis palliatus TaxID=336983 RepID=A0A2K5JXP1_COLAP
MGKGMVAMLSLGLLLLALLLPLLVSSFVPLTSTPEATAAETTKPSNSALQPTAYIPFTSYLYVLYLLHLFWIVHCVWNGFALNTN